MGKATSWQKTSRPLSHHKLQTKNLTKSTEKVFCKNGFKLDWIKLGIQKYSYLVKDLEFV